MAVQFMGVQPPKSGPAFEIVRLKAGQQIEAIILSEFPWGYLTHWIKRGRSGFSIECTKGVKTCQCASQELPTRFKGYLHLFDVRRSRECFLEFTPAIAEEIGKLVPEGENLRGLRCRCIRTKGADNGRLTFSILSPYRIASMEDMPASKDPRPYLERLWALCGPAPGASPEAA
jgi:hypothetical protein